MKWIKCILLSFYIISTSAIADGWREFSLKSIPQFGVQGEVEGKVKITQECVCFSIKSATIKVNPNMDYSTELIGIQLGLGFDASTDEWDVLGYSPIQPLPVVISSGKGVEVAPFNTSMPVPEKLHKVKHWVLMQIMMPDKKYGYSTTYAHEAAGLAYQP